MQTRRFTLLELLVVVAIITVLMGMVLASVHGVINHKNKTVTINGIRGLDMAIGQYYTTYNTLPFTLSAGTANDFMVNDPNGDGDYSDSRYQELLDTLQGQDKTLNPRGQKFLELEPGGHFTDAWGRNYRVVLDLNYDGLIDDNLVYGEAALARETAYWSAGRDGLESVVDMDVSNDDNLNSWKSLK